MTVDRWRGRRVYGWTRYLETPDETEAELIRQAAREVIDGRSPFDIAREWNDRGVRTANGAQWYGQTTEALLRRETNTIGDNPIIPKPVFTAMLGVLNAPGRSSTAQSRGKYVAQGRGIGLLSGVARCGMCGGYVKRVGSMPDGTSMLGCRPERHGRRDGERHPTAVRDPAEARAHEAVLEAFAADRGLTTEEATTLFEAMTLLERRTLVGKYLKITLNQHPRGLRGVVLIERRAA